MDDRHECVASASDTSAVLGPEQALEKIVVKSALATMGTPEYFTRFDALAPDKRGQRKVMMGDDPALSKMPAAPTLLDFFKLRFDHAAASHLLQSANLALKAGAEEKGVLACLLHDIAMVGLIGADHGYWGVATYRALRRRGGCFCGALSPSLAVLPRSRSRI